MARRCNLNEHARFARAQGVKDVVVAYNGDVVRLWPGPPEVSNHVPAGRQYKDGDLGLVPMIPACRSARTLHSPATSRLPSQSIPKVRSPADPEVAVAGLPAATDDGDPMIEVVEDAVDEVLAGLPRKAPRYTTLSKARSSGPYARRSKNEWTRSRSCMCFVMSV